MKYRQANISRHYSVDESEEFTEEVSEGPHTYNVDEGEEFTEEVSEGPPTYNVNECEELTEEVSEGPEVVVLEVSVEVVKYQLLLQSLLRLRDDPQVKVHRQSTNLKKLFIS